MSDSLPSPEAGSRDIPVKAIARFIEILKKKELEEEFLHAAPEVPTMPSSDPAQTSGLPKQLSREMSPFPESLFGRVADMVAAADGDVEALPAVRLALRPELMEYARQFAVLNDLGSVDPVAARLIAGTCGNGVDCPPGL